MTVEIFTDIKKPFPQVGIKSGFFVGLDPAPRFPAARPAFGNAVNHKISAAAPIAAAIIAAAPALAVSPEIPN